MSEEATLDEFASTSGNRNKEWSEEKLRNLIERDEAGVWGDESSGNGVRVLRATNYAPNNIDLSDVAIRDIPDSKKGSKELKSGDIVVERSGGSADQPVGRVLFFDLEGEYYHGNFLRQLRPDTSKINSRYLYYRLDYDYRRGNTKPLQTNTTNIRNLQYTSYLNQNISTPPKSQQRKIATVLYTVDRAIEKTNEIITHVEKLRKAIIDRIFTSGYREHPQRQSEYIGPRKVEYPAEWSSVNLEEITSKVTKGKTPTSYGSDYVDSGINFIKVESIRESGGFDKTMFDYIGNDAHEHLSGSELQDDDILFSIAGALGKVAIVTKSQLPANTNQALALIRIDDSRVLPEYVRYYLETAIIQKYIQSIATTTAQSNLNLKQVSEFRVLLPDVDEQKEILEAIQAVERRLENERLQKQTLKRLKRGLMQDLLSGTVRTTDTNIEVPEEIAQYG